jgi:hypothetical protein
MAEPTLGQRFQSRTPKREPNDGYAGPILAGQRWRSRGTSGHTKSLYSVLRYNGHTVKVVEEGVRHGAGKPYNIPEAAFRGNFNLVAQPPGVDVSEITVTPISPVEAAIVSTLQDKEVERIAPTGWPPNEGRPGAIHVSVERDLLSPPTYEEALEAWKVAKQNEEEAKMQLTNPVIPAHVAQELGVEPPPPPEPEPPAPPEDEVIVPLQETPNPLQSWISGGNALVEALTRDMASIAGKRDALLEQATALDAQHDQVMLQRNQIEAAVLSAIQISEGSSPSLSEAPTRVDAALDALDEAQARRRAFLERPRVSEPGKGSRFAPPPGKVSQREWVLRLLPASGGTLRVAGIRDAFAREYDLIPDAATKNVSSILGYQLKNPDPKYPAIERIEGGVYRVVR